MFLGETIFEPVLDPTNVMGGATLRKSSSQGEADGYLNIASRKDEADDWANVQNALKTKGSLLSAISEYVLIAASFDHASNPYIDTAYDPADELAMTATMMAIIPAVMIVPPLLAAAVGYVPRNVGYVGVVPVHWYSNGKSLSRCEEQQQPRPPSLVCRKWPIV
eukprot:gene3585-3384_t